MQLNVDLGAIVDPVILDIFETSESQNHVQRTELDILRKLKTFYEIYIIYIKMRKNSREGTFWTLKH